METVPQPPTVSPDGRFWLRDGEWVPLPAAPVGAATVASAIGKVVAQLAFVLVLLPMLLAVTATGAAELVPDRFDTVAAVGSCALLVLGVWNLRGYLR